MILNVKEKSFLIIQFNVDAEETKFIPCTMITEFHCHNFMTITGKTYILYCNKGKVRHHVWVTSQLKCVFDHYLGVWEQDDSYFQPNGLCAHNCCPALLLLISQILTSWQDIFKFTFFSHKLNFMFMGGLPFFLFCLKLISKPSVSIL